jgi:dihydroxyacetone kinase
LPADGIAAELIDRLVADLAPAAHRGIVLLINNLGATPSMELAIVARAALRELHARHIRVERVWCGTFFLGAALKRSCARAGTRGHASAG